MTRTRRIVAEALENIALLMLIYGIFTVPMYLIRQDIRDVQLLWLLIIPFAVNFLLRLIIKRVWIALPFHLIFPIAAFFLADGIFMIIVWVLAMAAAGICSLRHYFKQQPTSGMGVIVFYAAVFFVLAMWTAQAGYWNLSPIYPVLMMVSALAHVIIMHMLEIDKGLGAVQLFSTQPIGKILSFNYKLIAGLGVVVSGITLLFYFAIARPVLGFLIGLLNQLEIPALEMDMSWTLTQAPGTMGSPDWVEYFIQDYEPSLFVQFILLLLNIIMIVVGIAGVCFVIFIVFKGIFKWLAHGSKREIWEAPDADTGDLREFILPVNKGVQRKRFGKDTEHPIRRKFRETVIQQIKLGVKIEPCSTPTDISRLVSGEDINALTEEYSAVRYT